MTAHGRMTDGKSIKLGASGIAQVPALGRNRGLHFLPGQAGLPTAEPGLLGDLDHDRSTHYRVIGERRLSSINAGRHIELVDLLGNRADR